MIPTDDTLPPNGVIKRPGITIDFTPYLNRHGHKPTGFGYWIFRVGSEERVYSGLFSDALRQAKTHAKHVQQNSIEVLAGI